MVRYDEFLNTFHSLNFSRLTHPTNLALTINIVKTDSLFYQIFLNFPTILFELINQPNTDTKTYEFTSREVKQLSFLLDGLFLPTDNNPNKPFYLVEVQFQPDDNLYYRKLWSKASPLSGIKKKNLSDFNPSASEAGTDN